MRMDGVDRGHVGHVGRRHAVGVPSDFYYLAATGPLFVS